MSPRRIDYQKSRVYRAEDEVRGIGRAFRSRPQVQRYTDALVASDYWSDRGGPSEVLVLTAPQHQMSARGGRFNRWGWSIRLPMPSAAHYDPGLDPDRARGWWALDEVLVLHELAHVLAIHRAADQYAVGHDLEWVAEFVGLVGFAMGESAALYIAHAFSGAGCDGADDVTLAQVMDPRYLGRFGWDDDACQEALF